MEAIKDFRLLDKADELLEFKNEFNIPYHDRGNFTYFCGNSLGLQPKSSVSYVQREMEDWAKYGVEAHLKAHNPWVNYHEFLTEKMAEVVGAKPIETVVMNTLSVNLHLMMVSFYRPTRQRRKILIEYSAFPSDRYAVESQIKFHGFDPSDSLIILNPDTGLDTVGFSTIEEVFQKHGEEIALVLIGSVNYYTGQAYPIHKLTKLAHHYGCKIGFDLAHGAGNLLLNLHDDGPDFAVWCSYKYLNSGPGSLSGCFIHERHCYNFEIPRFIGWWAHDKINRFKMSSDLKLMPGAEGWQLSNPPILPMACMLASLELFHKAGMKKLRAKSLQLSGYLISLLLQLNHPKINILTPFSDEERGAQVSIQIRDADKSIYEKLSTHHIISDWREPDVIRVAPVPLYNSFQDVFHFYTILKEILKDYE